MHLINSKVFIVFFIFFIFFSVNSHATDISSLLDLYNVKNDLSGSYTQTDDIDLTPTNPASVSDWSSGNYSLGEYVKYSPYTYICIQNTTSSQVPTDTDYWKQLWESSKGWIPLGGSTAFTGDYDGYYGSVYHTISNLYINRPDEDLVGLFGKMEGTSTDTAELNNIKLQTVNIKGRSGVGSLLGKINDNQYVVIDRCSVVGGTVEAYRTCGGLVGANNGYPSGNPAKSRSKIHECFANVSVSYKYFADETTRDAEKFGGLVGCNQRGETYDSFALGIVSGSDVSNNAVRVGGLAGCVEQGLIVNCFSAGAVSGSGTNVGGLVGNVTGTGTGGVADSYWDTENSGQSSSASGTALTEEEMQTGTPFSNWNSEFWSFTEDSYPSLIWNPEYTLVNVLTNTSTLIYQQSGSYMNSNIGTSGNYISFQSANEEETETYLIFTEYSTDSDLAELSGLANPDNLSAYCRIWFEYQSGNEVVLTSLNSNSYFQIQFAEFPLNLWYRYNDGNWQIVPEYSQITGEEIPDYTFRININDLSITSRLGSNGIEFAADNGDNPLPVTLNSFSAVFDGEIPILQWVTASEINNAGWNVFRAQSNDFAYSMQVNPLLIQGQGTSVTNTNYQFLDFYDFDYDITYYYWLENVDYGSNTESFGPITLYIPRLDDENNNSPEVPLDFGLHSNYPNPFNPSTEISFILDYNSIVSLDIFNLKGEKIISLLDNTNVSKSELVISVWDGCDQKGRPCTSGIYFYRLTTGKETISHKMVLVK